MDDPTRVAVEGVLAQARALRDALIFVYESDQANVWRFGSYKTFMHKYNGLAKELGELTPLASNLESFVMAGLKSQFDTVAMQQKSYCDAVLTHLSILISIAEQALGAQASAVSDLMNFLQSRLRPAMIKRPDRETDVQDVVEQLLIGRGLTKGVDYDREVGRVKVSSKEVVPDFILPKLSLALEVKLLKDAARQSRLVDEINADIQSYGKSYRVLLFLVYDLGNIRDQVEFKQDLDNQTNVFVVTVKH